MLLKPSAKPLVFGSVNPFAKGGKSLKTKQNKKEWVWFLKPNQTHSLACQST